MKNPKVVIVMPAYNAAKTVKDTYKEIPKKYRKHIILVDDGSGDNTVEVAKSLGIRVFSHPNNLGYGGNQKTCYWEALKLNPDVVVMLHPDYQYDAAMIEDLISPIIEGRYDFMFGSRIANKNGALKGGMPPLKYYVNRIICLIQNILLGVNFSEHFSGFRAYSVRLLKKIPFQRFSNDFVFDQEMTISSIDHGMRIGEVAIETRYHSRASSIKFIKGVKFVLDGFIVIFRLYLNNIGFLIDRRFTQKGKKVHQADLFLFFLILISLLFMWRLTSFFGILIGLESILIFSAYKKVNYLKLSLIFLLLLALVISVLPHGLDSTLFERSNFEITQKAARDNYFTWEFGRLYANRIGLLLFEYSAHLTNFIRNIFSQLDLSYYLNVEKVQTIFLAPLFFLGIPVLFKKGNAFLLLYFISVFFIGAFFVPEYGSFFYLPLFILTIYLGFSSLVKNITE